MAEKKSKEEDFFMIFQSITGCMGAGGGMGASLESSVRMCSSVHV